MIETFDLAFADKDAAAEMRRDPLVYFEPLRVRILTQGLSAITLMKRRVHEFTKPLLVRLLVHAPPTPHPAPFTPQC